MQLSKSINSHKLSFPYDPTKDDYSVHPGISLYSSVFLSHIISELQIMTHREGWLEFHHFVYNESSWLALKNKSLYKIHIVIRDGEELWNIM
jgi:hypothetical protein